MLAEKLNMNPEEAECWIVNLIRNARLDAKIDSKLGHVVMGTQPLSPYQQLLEKIDTLSVRSEALQQLIERKVKAKTQEVNLMLFILYIALLICVYHIIFSKIHFGIILENLSTMVSFKSFFFFFILKQEILFIKKYFIYLFVIIKITKIICLEFFYILKSKLV